MRLSVRFTNIKMIMIEEGFCKNAWTSDIKRPEATQRHRSKGKSTGFEYLKYFYISFVIFFVTSFFGAFVNLCFFLFAKILCTYISILAFYISFVIFFVTFLLINMSFFGALLNLCFLLFVTIL